MSLLLLLTAVDEDSNITPVSVSGGVSPSSAVHLVNVHHVAGIATGIGVATHIVSKDIGGSMGYSGSPSNTAMIDISGSATYAAARLIFVEKYLHGAAPPSVARGYAIFKNLNSSAEIAGSPSNTAMIDIYGSATYAAERLISVKKYLYGAVAPAVARGYSILKNFNASAETAGELFREVTRSLAGTISPVGSGSWGGFTTVFVTEILMTVATNIQKTFMVNDIITGSIDIFSAGE